MEIYIKHTRHSNPLRLQVIYTFKLLKQYINIGFLTLSMRQAASADDTWVIHFSLLPLETRAQHHIQTVSTGDLTKLPHPTHRGRQYYHFKMSSADTHPLPCCRRYQPTTFELQFSRFSQTKHGVTPHSNCLTWSQSEWNAKPHVQGKKWNNNFKMPSTDIQPQQVRG